MGKHTKGTNSFRKTSRDLAGSTQRKGTSRGNSTKSGGYIVSSISERIIKETSTKRREAMKVLANR